MADALFTVVAVLQLAGKGTHLDVMRGLNAECECHSFDRHITHLG